MKLYELKSSLNYLCEFLDKNYSINCGGCCLLAYLIAQHLDKLSVKYKLVIYDDCLKESDKITEEILRMSKKKDNCKSVIGDGTCFHYSLLIEGAGTINEYFNEDESEYKYIIDKVHYRNIKWIYKHGSWNDLYDISNNDTVKGIINAFFKKYEKDNLSNYKSTQMS